MMKLSLGKLGVRLLVGATVAAVACVQHGCSSREEEFGADENSSAGAGSTAGSSAAGGADSALDGGTAPAAPAGAAGYGAGGVVPMGGNGGGVDQGGASEGGGPSERGGAGEGGGAGTDPIALTTVRVVDSVDKHPVEGATVLVHDVAGTIVFQDKTDASGTLLAAIGDGQTITAATIKGFLVDGVAHEARAISTATGVTPGGIITLLVDDPDNTTNIAQKPMSVTVTIDTPIVNVDANRTIYVPCGTDASVNSGSAYTYTVQDFKGCPGQKTFDVYGLVNRDGQLYAWDAKYDVQFAAGGSISIKLNATNSNVTTSRLHASPIPVGSKRLDYNVSGRRDGGSSFGDGSLIAPPGVDETLTVKLPGAPFSTFTAWGSLQISNSPFLIRSDFVRTGASVSADRDWAPVDVAVFKPTFKVDVGETSRPVASWDLETAGNLGDAIQTTLTWGSGSTRTSWDVWQPPARSGSIKLPELPQSLVDLRPKAGDSIYGYLYHWDLIGTGGYAEYLEKHVDLGTDNANWASLSQ